ncbi:helix-hairpin-helix domain-containing protein [Halomonas cupida]|uniref:helix-hairpin-helix domain-containing protein n=1 Tax=Halomonas cupida TaxID=44933 RepID=UPI003A8E6F4E
MAFSEDDRTRLLALHGVGETVVTRLEQTGLGTFETLAEADAEEVLADIAAMLGSSCWRNSPRAREAVAAAIAFARSHGVR